MLGGVPALLGGGGLELQMERTAAALRRRGHDVRDVRAFEPGDAVDVVHAFNHTGDVAHAIEHWRQTPAGLVLSPVLVVEPSHEWRTRVGKHLPIPTFPARALRDLLRASDAVVALTEWERAFMTQHGPVPAERVVIIGNGVDPVAPGSAPAELPERFLVSVGAVSPRSILPLGTPSSYRSSPTPYSLINSTVSSSRIATMNTAPRPDAVRRSKVRRAPLENARSTASTRKKRLSRSARVARISGGSGIRRL